MLLHAISIMMYLNLSFNLNERNKDILRESKKAKAVVEI
jgi:hypothetical protein